MIKIPLTALSLILSSSAFAIVLNDNAARYGITNMHPQGDANAFFLKNSLSTTFSLPTVIVDDVAHIDLGSQEALAEVIAGNEAVAAMYAEELDVSVEAILESAANMDDLSVEALEAGIE